MELTTKQKAAFGIGAVGKDMVYALSASYVMYYYQDVLGLPSTFVGLILMIARVFDAFNDPFMGVLVAKTRTRWGRFRPWIFSGTVLNAVVLYALFAAPVLEGAGMMVYFSVIYILWGVTYTMMDIPYWSMIPAVTRTPADRENLSVVGRTCAGVGSALIAMFTMLLVGALGGQNSRALPDESGAGGAAVRGAFLCDRQYAFHLPEQGTADRRHQHHSGCFAERCHRLSGAAAAGPRRFYGNLKANRNPPFSLDKLFACFDELGLEEELYDKRVNEISGGQRQRIMIAVATLMQKPLLIVDEPTSALDSDSTDKVLAFFRKRMREGSAILAVSHDQGFAQGCNQMITL